MILGMSLEILTQLHTIISLIAIAAGLIVLFGMLKVAQGIVLVLEDNLLKSSRSTSAEA